MRLFLAASIGLAVLHGAAAPPSHAQGSTRLGAIIVPSAEIRWPFTADSIGKTLAAIAESTGVLMGFETVMEDEPFTGLDRPAWTFRDITLAQALDQIVAADPRYEWRERQGVIHVRPKHAFEDGGHFLNRRVDHFELNDALPLHATFELHRIYRGGCEIRHPIYDQRRETFLNDEPAAMRKPVSLSIDGASVLEIMDAVIKAHGRLYWNVTYRLSPEITHPESAPYEYAVFSFADRPLTGGWWRMCVGDEDRFPR